MQRRATLIVACGLTGACMSAGESAPPVGISDSAGVSIVYSHKPQWRNGESWSVPTEPQMTLGMLDGPAEYQLFGVAAAARLTDGSFVVVDGGSRTIRRYDTDGRFVWGVGGRGSGPGKFEAPDQVVVTAGDSITIWDNALYRLTRLTPSGELVDVNTVDRGAIAKAVDPPLYPGTARLLPGDALLVRLIEKAKGSPAGIFRPRSGALRTSTDGLDIDTLMFFGGEEQEVVSAPWGPFPVARPAAKRTVMTVQQTASKACIGDQEGPAVACFGPEAARVLVRWNADPAPVTAEELGAWRDTTRALYAQKMTEAQLRQTLEQVTVPTTRPPYTQLTLDRAGNLWVARTTTTGSPTAAIEHLVFDPTGVWLGTVAVPPVRVLEIGEDYVLGLHRDDLGVEYLLAYRLLKPAPHRTAVQDGLRASMTPSGLLLVNADTVPLYFAVYDTRVLPLIEWAPCNDPMTCEHVPPNDRRTVAVARDASDTAMVFWWRLVSTAAGTLPDTVRTVPVAVR